MYDFKKILKHNATLIKIKIKATKILCAIGMNHSSD